MNEDYNNTTQVVGTLGAVGLIVGIGQLLASTEKLILRIVIGRALSRRKGDKYLFRGN